MSTTRILIVEDETKLLEHVGTVVHDAGFSVFTCESFRELKGILNIPTKTIHLIVLDRLLNGTDSSVLIPQIKETLPETKIMVLSAINTPSEKAALLDLGADDYVAKPFDGEELVARIRVLLRRTSVELKLGNLTLNSEKRTLQINGIEFALQNREYILLRTLLRTPGRIYTKLALYEQAWEVSTEVESNVIETTVNKLRRRLEEAGATVAIKSMRNKGYWIEE